MDNCKHVTHMTIYKGHSVLNPEKWQCCVCYTTESVWACLNCTHVACGRYNQEHALKHYKDTKHPLAIEVNDKYVFCYVCDDYVLNDNAASDIRILRNALSAVTLQSFKNVEKKGRRILRSHSFHSLGSRLQSEKYYKNEDIGFTVVKFRRYYLLAKVFCGWKEATNFKSKKSQIVPIASSTVPRSAEVIHKAIEDDAKTGATSTSSNKYRKAITPGNTGLRNLGNTCYMNSILQALSHLTMFRDYFINTTKHFNEQYDAANSINTINTSKLSSYLGNMDKTTTRPMPTVTALTTNIPSYPSYKRQSTLECFQYITSNSPHGLNSSGIKGGLNGGSSSSSYISHCNPASTGTTISGKYLNVQNKGHLSLYTELHTLLRVMWCGKWAIVSPHRMLDAVWQLIPFFKGYTQQDAQEFLCELLDKIKSEIRNVTIDASHASVTKPEDINSFPRHLDIIDSIFQGQLVSEVTCLVCGHTSLTYEPFMDLSLEFPDRYQPHNKSFIKAAQETVCSVEEMLSKFTETEKLDGKIYSCQQCNKRRQSIKLTEAKKKISIHRLPKVLRLHLKRFIIPEKKGSRASNKTSLKRTQTQSKPNTNKNQPSDVPPSSNNKSAKRNKVTNNAAIIDNTYRQSTTNKDQSISNAVDNQSVTSSECSFNDPSINIIEDCNVSMNDSSIDHSYASDNDVTLNTSTETQTTLITQTCQSLPTKDNKIPVNTLPATPPATSPATPKPSNNSLNSSNVGISPRWSGRNHRGKINVHVNLESILDLSPYLYSKRMRHHRQVTSVAAILGKRKSAVEPLSQLSSSYKLVSVVMHHGRGFGSGHYTAYCYNKEAESWIHYNDAHVTYCQDKDVLNAQAYILFYERTTQESYQQKIDNDVTFNFNSKKSRMIETEQHSTKPKLKRVKTTTW